MRSSQKASSLTSNLFALRPWFSVSLTWDWLTPCLCSCDWGVFLIAEKTPSLNDFCSFVPCWSVTPFAIIRSKSKDFQWIPGLSVELLICYKRKNVAERFPACLLGFLWFILFTYTRAAGPKCGLSGISVRIINIKSLPFQNNLPTSWLKKLMKIWVFPCLFSLSLLSWRQSIFGGKKEIGAGNIQTWILDNLGCPRHSFCTIYCLWLP